MAKRFFWAIIFLYFVRLGIYLFSSLDFLIGHTLSDDAFYYLKIARNVWDLGLFPTFDGLNKTNGFHFLYQFLLIPLAPLYSASLHTLYVVIIFLNEMFFFAGCLLLWRILKSFFPLYAALPCFGFVLLGHGTFDAVVMGLEAALAFMLAMLFLYLLFCRNTKPWILGLVLGLLILSRLDIGALYALWFGLYSLTDIIRKRGKSPSLRRLPIIVAVSALLVLPMVAFNLTQFGHVGTISQATKAWVAGNSRLDAEGNFSIKNHVTEAASGLPHYGKKIAGEVVGSVAVALPYMLITGETPHSDELGEVLHLLADHFVFWLTVMLGIAGISALVLLLIGKDNKNDVPPFPMRGLLMGFLLGIPVVHILLVTQIIGKHAGSWYWLFFILGIGIALSLLAAKKGFIGFGARWILVFLALGGFSYNVSRVLRVGALSSTYEETSWYSSPMAVADYLHDNKTPEMIVGCFNAGFFGYIAPVPVVNLDGLVNNWELLEARKKGEVRDYIQSQGITHIADVGSYEKYLSETGFSTEESSLVYQSSETDGFLVKLPEPSSAKRR